MDGSFVIAPCVNFPFGSLAVQSKTKPVPVFMILIRKTLWSRRLRPKGARMSNFY